MPDASTPPTGEQPDPALQPSVDIDVLPTVREMRQVVTADDHTAAVHFYGTP